MFYLLTAFLSYLVFSALSMLAETDNGVINMVGGYFGPNAITTTPYIYMCISTEVAAASTSAAYTAGTTYANLAITGPGGTGGATAAISAGNIYLDYNGTGQNGTTPQEYLQTTGCAAGATSLPVLNSAGGAWVAQYTHASGKTVVPVAPTTDNPSGTPTGGIYQTLTSSNYGAITGSGVGNRSRTITATFLGASVAAGSYTAVRLSNTTPITAGSVGATSYIPPAVINSTTNGTFAITIKN